MKRYLRAVGCGQIEPELRFGHGAAAHAAGPGLCLSGKFCSAQLIASFIVKRAAVVSNDCAFVFLRCVASIVRMPEGSCRSGRAVYGPGVPKR